ncbi:signal peptidase II [Pseudonocardia asaccharolytica]|uniref:Lipoprotein signal peptidase n=1 Tax=Pseudonocardia asaccharolytica DSM 44247 = NBRC 16224 TaxID=1123024 RepID=A0A511D4C1_9PSEU|nr:signal peptidase II [Pseudonocardia asaccharolytica]GEL18444.1 lipoprotein signal peptidase [Pseudonocardia asaccharolytica DSM 44247 = NBRC 16224]
MVRRLGLVAEFEEDRLMTSKTGSDAAVPTHSARRLLPWVFLLAAGVVAVDQFTKWWAETSLLRGEATPVLGEFIQWRLFYNPGAAFGLAAEFTWVLTVVAGLAVVGLVVLAARVLTRSWAIGVGVLLGGAVSHLGDRLLREPGFGRGHIVDFIDYYGLFVGNVADIALVGGAGFVVLLSLIGVDLRPGQAPRRTLRPSPELR